MHRCTRPTCGGGFVDRNAGERQASNQARERRFVCVRKRVQPGRVARLDRLGQPAVAEPASSGIDSPPEDGSLEDDRNREHAQSEQRPHHESATGHEIEKGLENRHGV